MAGVAAGLMAFAACGDDDGPKGDATPDATDVGEVEVTPDALEETSAEDASAEVDEDVADTTSDTGPDGDTAVDTIDPDATPEQRAILEVPETARFAMPGLSAPV